MAIKFSCCFLSLKIVDFQVGNNILWDAKQQCGYTMLLDHLHTCYVIIFLGN